MEEIKITYEPKETKINGKTLLINGKAIEFESFQALCDELHSTDPAEESEGKLLLRTECVAVAYKQDTLHF